MMRYIEDRGVLFFLIAVSLIAVAFAIKNNFSGFQTVATFIGVFIGYIVHFFAGLLFFFKRDDGKFMATLILIAFYAICYLIYRVSS